MFVLDRSNSQFPSLSLTFHITIIIIIAMGKEGINWLSLNYRTLEYVCVFIVANFGLLEFQFRLGCNVYLYVHFISQ